MYKVVILPIAKQDIRNAALWYNSRQKGLGKRFTAEVQRKAKFIAKNPKASSERYDDVRTAILDVFPFMIHYRLQETTEDLLIYAVLHTSRNPDLWNNENPR